MISIISTQKFIPEKKYLFDTIFGEFLGLEYKATFSNDNVGYYVIILPNNKKLYFRDIFFSHYEDGLSYLKDNIPDKIAFITDDYFGVKNLPIIYGGVEQFINIIRGDVFCSLDIFASIFFMLTRWEEYVSSVRDAYGRFPTHASLAYKWDFLERPVVNEYLDLLFALMNFLDSNLSRKKRQYRQLITHDIDYLSMFCGKSFYFILRKVLFYTLKKRLPGTALNALNQWFWANFIDSHDHALESFNRLMDVSEKNNSKSLFYFMAARKSEMDDGYSLFSRLADKVIEQVLRRGHDVGLHASFYSYNNESIFAEEVRGFSARFPDKGSISCRQHYLRLDIPVTWRIQNAYVDSDSSLGYVDRAGFRCGVCYEFPLYDILSRKKLRLIEKPLILMDCSLINEKYMFLSCEDIVNKTSQIRESCKKHHGNFIVLWHNAPLMTKQIYKLYDLVVSKN